MRGIAQDQYGIDLTPIDWYVDDADEAPIDIPSEFNIKRIPETTDLDQLLVSGDLDTAMHPNYPSSFMDPSSDIEFLFPDHHAVTLDYYRETNIFPIMHVVVIRDTLVSEHPWLPTSIRKAFYEANQVAKADLKHLRQSRDSLAWAQTVLDDAGTGYDFLETEDQLWSSDLSDAIHVLETAIDYAQRFGLLDHKVDPRSLFFESSLKDLPQTV